MCTLRVYRSCFFFIGTKIPFSQWPSLVDRYLDNLGLSYQAFLYDFEDMDLSAYYQKILSGEITAESGEGSGTVFTATLPLAEQTLAFPKN